MIIDQQFAFVAAVRVQAGEELDQGRFAGAVLPAERVDFPNTQIKRDVAERDDAGKALRDLTSSEDGWRGVRGALGRE
jgi:hypothetical protein